MVMKRNIIEIIYIFKISSVLTFLTSQCFLFIYTKGSSREVQTSSSVIEAKSNELRARRPDFSFVSPVTILNPSFLWETPVSSFLIYKMRTYAHLSYRIVKKANEIVHQKALTDIEHQILWQHVSDGTFINICLNSFPFYFTNSQPDFSNSVQ